MALYASSALIRATSNVRVDFLVLPRAVGKRPENLCSGRGYLLIIERGSGIIAGFPGSLERF